MNGTILQSNPNTLRGEPPDMTPVESPVYGVDLEYTNDYNNPIKITRIPGTTEPNMRFKSGTTGDIISDFDDIYPWSEMKLCNVNIASGNIIYEGDSNFSYNPEDSGSINDILMVEIPKFYYKVDNVAVVGSMYPNYRIQISKTSQNGSFNVSPRHKGKYTKNDYNKIYVSANLINGSNENLLTEYLQNASSKLNYHSTYFMDYQMYMTILLLKIVETGKFNTGLLTTMTSEFTNSYYPLLASTSPSREILNADSNELEAFIYRGLVNVDLTNLVTGIFFDCTTDPFTLKLFSDPPVGGYKYSAYSNWQSTYLSPFIDKTLNINSSKTQVNSFGVDDNMGFDYLFYPKYEIGLNPIVTTLLVREPSVENQIVGIDHFLAGIVMESYNSTNIKGTRGIRYMYLPE